MAYDFTSELTRISRAWSAARTNGAVALVLRETLDLARGRWLSDAAGLPGGSIYDAENVTRDVRRNTTAVEARLKVFGGVMTAALPASVAAKQSAFADFQRAWVDASVIYMERPSVFGSMVSDLFKEVESYGAELAAAGVAAPAKVIGDVAKAASKNVRTLGAAAGDVARDVGGAAGEVLSGAGDAVTGALFGGWKLALLAGVLIYVARKPIAVGLRGIV
jgi:hypothetical protein